MEDNTNPTSNPTPSWGELLAIDKVTTYKWPKLLLVVEMIVEADEGNLFYHWLQEEEAKKTDEKAQKAHTEKLMPCTGMSWRKSVGLAVETTMKRAAYAQSLSVKLLVGYKWEELVAIIANFVEADESHFLYSWLQTSKKTAPKDLLMPCTGRNWEDSIELAMRFHTATLQLLAAQAEGPETLQRLVDNTNADWENEVANDRALMAERNAIGSQSALGENLASLISLIPLVGVIMPLLQPLMVRGSAEKLNKIDQVLKIGRKRIHELEIERSVQSGAKKPGHLQGHVHFFKDPKMFRETHGAHRTAFVRGSIGTNLLTALVPPGIVLYERFTIGGFAPWVIAALTLMLEVGFILWAAVRMRRIVRREI